MAKPRQKSQPLNGRQGQQARDWEPLTRRQQVPTEDGPGWLWANAEYTVIAYPPQTPPGLPPLIHLSIRRNDHQQVRLFRHLQKIKNQLVGDECEAIEIFPKESRLVDTANQYHLYCFADPKFTLGIGYSERLVAEGPYTNGSVQEPWSDGDRPADVKHERDIQRMLAEQGRARGERGSRS